MLQTEKLNINYFYKKESMENQRKKIAIFSNIPAPYFVDYCEELSIYADLTVVFELKTAKNRQKCWYKKSKKFKTVFLKSIRLSKESALSLGFKKILKNNHFDFILVCNPLTPTGILLIRYLKKHHYFYAIQSEGGFQKSGKGLKEKIKKSVISNASFYLSGMSLNDSGYFSFYAHKNAKIYSYHFASYRENLIDKKLLSNEEKSNLRAKLDLGTVPVILYVGHFIPSKGFSLVLELANLMKDKPVSICFVGGKPSDEDLKYLTDNNINNVKFLSFLDQKELSNVYHAASLLVLPTYSDTWGLVVNEAMSNGLPVLTSDMCVAGLEFFKEAHPECLIKTGEINDLFEKVSNIIFDEEKLYELGNFGLERIKQHSIENMAQEVFGYITKEFEERENQDK